MWIFDSPKTYSEMVEKIAKSTFVISLFLLYIFTCANKEFALFLKGISFDVEYEFIGIKLSLALLYLPLIIGIAEHIFKVHDKISDIFKIRSNYDKNVIVKEFFRCADINKSSEEMSPGDVNKLLSDIFYPYVSSTVPKIDTHYIHLTLNVWCWYWIILDTLTLLLFIGSTFLVTNWSCIDFFRILSICLIFLLILHLIRKQAIQYTQKEIGAIFSDTNRKNEIVRILKNAL